MAFYEHKTKKGPVIVAEISGNHGGKLERAQDLMLLAKKHGADAIKIQTYEADSLTIDSKREEFMIRGGLWAGQSLYELYQKACTPRSFVKPLFEFAKEHEIFLFSSPFSAKDVEVLEENACPAALLVSPVTRARSLRDTISHVNGANRNFENCISPSPTGIPIMVIIDRHPAMK